MKGPAFADRVFAILRAMAVWLDRRVFAPVRADYYEFLSALMEGAQGRYTLRDIFDRDAHRYAGRVRGRLAHSWSHSYALSGGDLYTTWYRSFPESELAIIRVAQLSGNDALVRSLHELALSLRLTRRARHIVWVTLWSGALSFCMLLITILAVPFFTVPRLSLLFGMLPPEYLSGSTRTLFRFAAVVESAWAFIALAAALGVAVLLWSISSLTGPFRAVLDKVSIWRIYRIVSALRFMSILTVVLQRQSTSSTQLRTALSMMCVGAAPWLRWHLDLMLERIDYGLVGADTFDTGLLDKELHWYLQDMAEARGLVHALQLVRDRLEGHVLGQVARQAQVLRWMLLLGCVSGILALGLWHYAVIDDLRRSLMIFHASQ